MSAGSSTKVVYIALGVNLSIACVKGVAALLTGSAAMLAETVHSFVDCGNQVLLLMGMKRSLVPATKEHPLGYHRELYFWTLVVAGALFVGGGVASLYEGMEKVLHPAAMPMVRVAGHVFPGWWMNVCILLISGLLEGYGFVAAIRSMPRKAGVSLWGMIRRSADPGLFVVVFEDGSALVSLTIALVFTVVDAMTGLHVLDGVASLLIGGVLVVVAGLLTNETRSLLVGESNPEIDAFVRLEAGKLPGVVGVNEVVTETRGPDSVIVLLSLDWKDTLLAGDVERGVSALEKTVRTRFPMVRRMYIEAQDKRDGLPPPL
ncbi:cation diffusion facilitator family transporter [Gluconobacter morbifer]|uniref:Cation efflux system protein n=1 Tax=Gluconobacter morbifer G707 TaxID=1088869 RepID=G6XLF2_9PROT|nr:cation diffusion facilitator family transporter [Gluconobacter morbifer]EHH67207.1 cation efflux system protein [Gluconobacter morbifer G707]